ncbi:YcxB family protein [Ralstonia solanacearum]|uniref:YcxB family protein n=1 Tax=Ralstonia solanacearum TaxID=305 RepID=UPI000B1C00CC|nr:YcxB family protein [Ralstonia solanacearum]
MAHAFQTTELDAIGGYRLHYTMNRAKAVRTAMVLALAVATYVATKNPYAAALAGGAAGILVLHAVILYVVVPNRGKHLYQQQKNLHLEYPFTWDDQSVYVHAENYQEPLRWADLTKAKENEAMVLLYRSDYNFSIFPKRCFSSTEEYAEFQSHLVPCLIG